MDIGAAKKMGLKLSDDLPTYDVPIDLIEPDPDNPNLMDDDTFNRLVSEMEENGSLSPILIAPYPGNKFRIVGGEHRWRAAVSLGWETIPANIKEDLIDDDLRQFLLVRMNVVSGKIDHEKFASLYKDKIKKYGHEQLRVLFGYTNTGAWSKLTSGVVGAISSSGIGGKSRSSASIAKEVERRTSGIKNPADLAKIISDVMQNHGVDRKSVAMFSYGGDKHFHIAMTDELSDAMQRLISWSRENDIATVDALLGAISLYLDKEVSE